MIYTSSLDRRFLPALKDGASAPTVWVSQVRREKSTNARK